jgi:hypothetical protein
MSIHRELLAIKFSGRPAADLENFGLEKQHRIFFRKLASCLHELFPRKRKPPR